MTTLLAVMGCFALIATFMGLITDPLLQRSACIGVVCCMWSTRWSAWRWEIARRPGPLPDLYSGAGHRPRRRGVDGDAADAMTGMAGPSARRHPGGGLQSRR